MEYDEPDFRQKQYYTCDQYGIQFSRVARSKKIDGLLNKLHKMQLQMIDDAVDLSDLSKANEVIDYIKSKL